MAGSCGAFCSFCGKCGRRVTKEFNGNRPLSFTPPGVPASALGREEPDEAPLDPEEKHATRTGTENGDL